MRKGDTVWLRSGTNTTPAVLVQPLTDGWYAQAPSWGTRVEWAAFEQPGATMSWWRKPQMDLFDAVQALDKAAVVTADGSRLCYSQEHLADAIDAVKEALRAVKGFA